MDEEAAGASCFLARPAPARHPPAIGLRRGDDLFMVTQTTGGCIMNRSFSVRRLAVVAALGLLLGLVLSASAVQAGEFRASGTDAITFAQGNRVERSPCAWGQTSRGKGWGMTQEANRRLAQRATASPRRRSQAAKSAASAKLASRGLARFRA